MANSFVIRLDFASKVLVSVPLRGKYHGEWFYDLSKQDRHQVSVPLRGKYHGEFLADAGLASDYQGFRPLAG